MIMFNIQYMNPVFDTVLRGHNWVHFAHHGYSVLLPWIQTLLSWEPEIIFN